MHSAAVMRMTYDTHSSSQIATHLLVFTKFSIDWYWQLVVIYLVWIQQLIKKI